MCSPIFLLCMMGCLTTIVQAVTKPMPMVLEVELGKERLLKFYLGKDVDYETAKRIGKQKELLITFLRKKESLLPLPSTDYGVQANFHFYEVPFEITNGIRSSVIPSDFVLLNNGAVMEPNDLRFTTPVKGNYYFSLTIKKPLAGPYSNLTVKFYRNGTAILPMTSDEEGVIDTVIKTKDGKPDDGNSWLLRNVEMTLPLEANDKMTVQIEIDGDEENQKSLATDKITQWYYNITSYMGFIVRQT